MDEPSVIDKDCNIANNNLKKAFKTDVKKFSYGHKWLRFKSNNFLNESCGSYPKKYNYYQRGTILYVDFGVNLGGEFCGRHFAISLNKKDSSYDSTITVIPLTSKGGKKKIKLGKALITPYQNVLDTNLTILKDKIENMKTDIDWLDSIRESEKDNIESSEKFLAISKKVKSITNDLNDLEIIAHQTRKLNVDSYALSEHIYTISKQKIIKRNKYDPTGQISIDDDLLKILSENLVNKFNLV